MFKYMLKFKNIFNFLPLSVTLTLSLEGIMGSAHPLVEVNIWAKIKENLPISVGHDIMSNIWLFDIWPSIVTLTLS